MSQRRPADPVVAPAEPAPGDEVLVGDVAEAFVAAVCRPQDVEDVRASVARLDPDDLAGLVAAVDEHQPMTLEVAVDVLAELGVAATGIATAVGVDVEDVRVLLGSSLGGPPPSLRDRDARIIEVVGGGVPVTGATPVADDEVDEDPGVVDGDPPVQGRDHRPTAVGHGMEEPGPEDGVDGTGGERPGANTSGEDAGEAGPPIVRIDEVADADRADRVAADLEATAGADPHRGRAWFAALLFVLLVVGALVVAWQLGAF